MDRATAKIASSSRITETQRARILAELDMARLATLGTRVIDGPTFEQLIAGIAADIRSLAPPDQRLS